MKKIPLSQGKFALVDDEDYDYLMLYTWHLTRSGYAQGWVEGCKQWMHRVIMKTPSELFTDHINRTKLDNRKANLRVATSSQNNQNKKPVGEKTSIYKGVNWHKHDKKWMSRIQFLDKRIFIGNFDSEIEAGKAYNRKAIELFGEFAYLNPI